MAESTDRNQQQQPPDRGEREGGNRPAGHVGVIEELTASGVVIDRVAGASLGAYIGAMFASGVDAAEIDARCYDEWVRRSPLNDYRFCSTECANGDHPGRRGEGR